MTEFNDPSVGTNFEPPYDLLARSTRKVLHPTAQTELEEHLREFGGWLTTSGADPDSHEGKSEDSIRRAISTLNMAIRTEATLEKGAVTWKYPSQVPDEYTSEGLRAPVSPETAEAVIDSLQQLDREPNTIRRHGNSFESYFEWLIRTDQLCPRKGFTVSDDLYENEWENSSSPAKGRFSDEQYKKLLDAALILGTPDPEEVNSEERAKFERELSMKLGKPIEEVSDDDFREETMWMIPSVLIVGAETAMRAKTVQYVETSWFDDNYSEITIPNDSEGKRNRRKLQLTEMAQRWVRNWIEERETLSRFDDADEEYEDRMWLTREGTPFDGNNARTAIERLKEIAGIDDPGINLTWKSLKKTTLTRLCQESGWAEGMKTSGHKDVRSIVPYNIPDEDSRQEALKKMNQRPSELDDSFDSPEDTESDSDEQPSFAEVHENLEFNELDSKEESDEDTPDTDAEAGGEPSAKNDADDDPADDVDPELTDAPGETETGDIQAGEETDVENHEGPVAGGPEFEDSDSADSNRSRSDD